MKTLVFGLCLLVFLASPVAAESLQMSFRDGRVTIDAQDVTVRRILTEWARLGKTQIVNAERIAGGPITLKLENLPEKQALEVILRTVPGYMAMPRQTLVADASLYDRILLMPTTSAVATARPQGPPGFPGVQPGANVTQLRPTPPMLSPGTLPEPPEPADQEDAAIAAAAAAGLVPVPAPAPIQSAISAPLVLPGAAQPPANQSQPGTAASPANPFGATGTAAPTFTPPPAPPTTTTAPLTRPRPPQPDR